MLTAAERRQSLDAIVEELVAQGLSRADAETHVREQVAPDFDVIAVPAPPRRPRRPAPAAR